MVERVARIRRAPSATRQVAEVSEAPVSVATDAFSLLMAYDSLAAISKYLKFAVYPPALAMYTEEARCRVRELRAQLGVDLTYEFKRARPAITFTGASSKDPHHAVRDVLQMVSFWDHYFSTPATRDALSALRKPL